MLLVETEVVDQLLLDLEGLATFLTLVPATGMKRDEKKHNTDSVNTLN